MGVKNLLVTCQIGHEGCNFAGEIDLCGARGAIRGREDEGGLYIKDVVRL
jgi:hypothetical protein